MLRAALLAVTGVNFLRATLFAQAAGGSDPAGGPDYVSYLLNGGPFAIVLLLIITDKLAPTGERDRLRTELTAAHEREAALNDNLRKEIVPALTQNTAALTRATEALLRDDQNRRE